LLNQYHKGDGKEMRTKKEIEKKLKEVEKERKTIKEYNIFGGNNWRPMDKQIEILKKCIKDKNYDAQEELDKMIDYNDGNFPESEIEKAKMDILDFVVRNTD